MSGSQAQSGSASMQTVSQGREERQCPEWCPGDPAAKAAHAHSPPERSNWGATYHGGTRIPQVQKGLDSAERIKKGQRTLISSFPRKKLHRRLCWDKLPCKSSVQHMRSTEMSSHPGAQSANSLCLFSQLLIFPSSLIPISTNSLLAKVLCDCQSYVTLLLYGLFAVSTSWIHLDSLHFDVVGSRTLLITSTFLHPTHRLD